MGLDLERRKEDKFGVGRLRHGRTVKERFKGSDVRRRGLARQSVTVLGLGWSAEVYGGVTPKRQNKAALKITENGDKQGLDVWNVSLSPWLEEALESSLNFEV